MEDPPQSGVGRTVCVTGASGFLGSHLVKQLLQRGYSVRGTVRDANNEAQYGWIKALAEGTTGKVELYSADLTVPGSFDKVMEGCEYVCHVAAAVIFNAKDPTKEVLDPALEGTRNVFSAILKARAAKRVAVTSSVAALFDYEGSNGKTFTEEDWHHEMSLKDAYSMGKTLGEKHAWKVYEDQKAKGDTWSFELVVINSAFLLGELLHDSHARTSVESVKKLMDGSAPMAPDFWFSLVHVKDVALAHVLGIENEESKGRYILSEDNSHSMLDIARIIKMEYPYSKAPTMAMPNLLLFAFAFLNPVMDFESMRKMAGNKVYFSNKKVLSELGMKLISPEQAVLDTAKSLIERGLVPQPSSEPSPTFPFLSFLTKTKSKSQAPGSGSVGVANTSSDETPGKLDI